MNIEKNQSEVYQSWVQLIPATVGINEVSSLMFPLNEPKTYTISSSGNSDLVLPQKLQNVVVQITVDKNGMVEIQNTSTSVSTETISVSENQLKPNEKTEVSENAVVRIGPQVFNLQRVESPSLTEMNAVFGNLQCSVCNKFYESAKSLPCQHVVCEPCFVKMINNKANVSNAQTPSYKGTNKISCPVCRRSLPDTSEVQSQKVLSDISKLFQDVMESRPNCAVCANKRWVVHGCDYYCCEICDKVLCPLCALDFHRDHSLKSNFLSMYIASREFMKQTAPVKRDWANILKQVDESKENGRKANMWIESMKTNLRQMETKVNAIMNPCTTAYNTVQGLAGLRFDDKTEASREEAVKNLENEVNKIKDRIALMVTDITEKVNILTDSLNKLKNVAAEEDNEVSKLESPLSSPSSS